MDEEVFLFKIDVFMIKSRPNVIFSERRHVMNKIFQIKMTQYGVESSLLARLHCLLGLSLYKFQPEMLQTKRRHIDEYRT